jgi:hypothetical protein
MFESRAELVLVTTNAMVRSNGSLVMGRGAAKELVDRFPRIDRDFGSILRMSSLVGKTYGVMILGKNFSLRVLDDPGHPGSIFHCKFGVFQVKYHWKDKASLNLIHNSVERLCELIDGNSAHNYRISLNFPGIENGKLTREQVMPYIEKLPDNVTVWEKE